jgi:hypothetical protein
MAEFGHHETDFTGYGEEYNNGMYCYGPFTPASNGTLTSLSYYRFYGGDLANSTMALYEDSSGSPGARVACSAEQADTSGAGWKTYNATCAISSSKSYWIAVQKSGGSSYPYEKTGTGSRKYSTATYAAGNLVDPFGTHTTSTSKYGAFYATYTETPSGPSIPIVMNYLRQMVN